MSESDKAALELTDYLNSLREAISALVRTYDGVKDWTVTTPTGAVIKLSEVFGSCAEHLRGIL